MIRDITVEVDYDIEFSKNRKTFFNVVLFGIVIFRIYKISDHGNGWIWGITIFSIVFDISN